MPESRGSSRALAMLFAVGAVLVATCPFASTARAAYPVAQNGRIVFDSYVGPTTPHVFVMNADGSNRVDLSPASTFGDASPQFSPNGRFILFTRYLDPNDDSAHLMLMPVTGGAAVDLTPGIQNADQPTFSPDGHQIAFLMDVIPALNSLRFSIAIMNADGSGVRELTPNDTRGEASPDFSTDGTKIIFSRADVAGVALYTINPDGSGESRLTPTSGPADHDGAFSPNGAQVAFARDPDKSGVNTDVFLGNLGLGGAVDLTPAGPAQPYKQDVSVSPDTTKVAYDGSGAGNQHIFVVPSSGGSEVDLSPPSATIDGLPHWEYLYMCAHRRATIVGDDGPDVLRGTKQADVIVGNGGKDRIKGKAGNDRICGGRGKDRLVGGKGKDRLIGGPGRDKVKQ